MASSTGQTTDSLIRFLGEPDEHGTERFLTIDFFRLVRLLEALRPDLPRVGCSLLPADDIVRFAQRPYENFASSTLQALEALEGRPPRVSVAFFGMFGPCGALPPCYTEHALQRLGPNRAESKTAQSPGGTGLKVSDFRDLQSWVRRLRRHEDPMTKLIWADLPASFRQKVQDLTPAAFQVSPLREEFVRQVGEAMAHVDLWPAAAQMGLSPSKEVEELVRKRSADDDFFRVNRYLIGLGFKQEIAFVRRLAATAWDFEPWHFSDLTGVVRQCRDGANVFSRVVRECFPARARQLLADFSPGQFAAEPLLSDFLDALNELAATADLIGLGACAEMDLPEETRALGASHPAGDALARLNRTLLVTGFGGKVSARLGESQRDRTLTRFLDIFHHRLLSHFYRAWAINQVSADLDRPDNPKAGERQKFPFYLSCLAGTGLDAIPVDGAITGFSRIYYSGHLLSQARNVAGLQSILQDYFGVPTRVLPFAGRWLTLPEENLCRLGHSPSTGLLGQSVIAGSKMWDCKLSFRVRMGPLGLADFTRLLPRRQILCSRCGRPLEPASRQQALLDKLPESVTRALAAEGGCPHCHYTGPEDWDTELVLSAGRAALGPKRIVCKKCRTPFGPEELQRELQDLPPERVAARLARGAGCAACHASQGRDWRVVEVGSFHRLKCWIKSYLGDEYFWDLQLILRKEDAPVTQLGRTGRLGQTIWPKCAPPTSDLEDVVIVPDDNFATDNN